MPSDSRQCLTEQQKDAIDRLRTEVAIFNSLALEPEQLAQDITIVLDIVAGSRDVDEPVLCSLRYPDFVCHLPHADCDQQAPHHIDTCGRFLLPREGYKHVPEARAEGSPQGWQEIGTAPKDGTRVHVARYLENHGWILGVGRYEMVGVIGGWISYGVGPFGELGLGHPTHWQPLPPAPPAPGSAEEGR